MYMTHKLYNHSSLCVQIVQEIQDPCYVYKIEMKTKLFNLYASYFLWISFRLFWKKSVRTHNYILSFEETGAFSNRFCKTCVMTWTEGREMKILISVTISFSDHYFTLNREHCCLRIRASQIWYEFLVSTLNVDLILWRQLLNLTLDNYP